MLSAFFRAYINSSSHVALAVVSLCALTSLNYGIPLNHWLLLFVFFSTVVGYNFAKYFPSKKQKKSAHPKSFKFIKIISFISLIGLLFSCFFIRLETVLVSIGLSVFNFFYAIPLPHKTLREVPFLKVFIIAFIWTAVTLGLPIIEAQTNLVYDHKLYFDIVERFCWIILLLIPFEIRDYNYDKHSLKTLATVFGINGLKVFGIALILILAFLRLRSDGFENKVVYSIIYLSLALVLVLSKRHQSQHYASFWVEGLPIFWLACWLMLDTLNYSF